MTIFLKMRTMIVLTITNFYFNGIFKRNQKKMLTNTVSFKIRDLNQRGLIFQSLSV